MRHSRRRNPSEPLLKWDDLKRHLPIYPIEESVTAKELAAEMERSTSRVNRCLTDRLNYEKTNGSGNAKLIKRDTQPPVFHIEILNGEESASASKQHPIKIETKKDPPLTERVHYRALDGENKVQYRNVSFSFPFPPIDAKTGNPLVLPPDRREATPKGSEDAHPRAGIPSFSLFSAPAAPENRMQGGRSRFLFID
jgi:hypothetical protein